MSPGLTDYAEALSAMEARAAAIAAGEASELIWLLEHPPVYTAGTSADPAELIDPRFPVVPAGRGWHVVSLRRIRSQLEPWQSHIRKTSFYNSLTFPHKFPERGR